MATTAATVPTAARAARPHGAEVGPSAARTALASASAAVAALFLGSGTALAQQTVFEYGINTTGTLSSNPDLVPDGQENAGFLLNVSPYFWLSRTGDRLRLVGGGDLGLEADLRQDSDGGGVTLRPRGSLTGTLEAIDNFFFVEARAVVERSLDNPFLASPSATSAVNTSAYYQLGVTPFIRGQLLGRVDYEVRSDNSWTNDFNDQPMLYSGRHSASLSRAPQPVGWGFSFNRDSLESDVEGQGNLVTDVARFSLRYAVTANFAVGARLGTERYNYTLAADDWQRFYGVEVSWRPNERTALEGYWEDRAFGNGWNLSFTHRRPRLAFSVQSSRDLSSTPQQFLTFPALANVAALLDAAFTTRIPDPAERQRAVIDFLSRTQLPAELLTPTVIYNQQIQIQANTSASVVLYGPRNSLAFTLFRTKTEGVAGLSTIAPVLQDTVENGASLGFNHRMTPITSLGAFATYRRTESVIDSDAETSQTEFRVEASRQVGVRTFGTLGARYQWIDSTVTNDSTETAIYFTLNHRF